VGATFALTFLLDLGLYLTVGYGSNTGTGYLLQVQMLIPATVAIALQYFFFKNSPIYRLPGRPRWFFLFYMAYALVYAALAVSVVLVPSPGYQAAAAIVAQVLNVGGVLLVVVLRLLSGREAFQRAGLSGGKVWQYVVFGLLVVSIYGLMTGLNALFGLGQAVDVKEFIRQAAGGQATGMEALSDLAILAVTGLQGILISPFLALLIAFGEEYGWRRYLQDELVKLGKVRGILLLGVIWGLWHAPVVVMGHNYPGYPFWGVILMTFYTIALAFLFGYAVLKSGSVWLAAFLHGLNNQVASFFFLMVYKPDDPVFSFGLGLYGLLVWAILIGALLLLDRKEWTTPVQPVPEAGLPGPASAQV